MNTSFSLVNCKYTSKTSLKNTYKHIQALIKMLFTDRYKIVCISYKKISGINFALPETPDIIRISIVGLVGNMVGKRA